MCAWTHKTKIGWNNILGFTHSLHIQFRYWLWFVSTTVNMDNLAITDYTWAVVKLGSKHEIMVLNWKQLHFTSISEVLD